jgi:hypothetical protein
MNWGPGAAGGFQNALSTGLQLGQMVRQQKQENALMQQRQEIVQAQQQEAQARQQQAQTKAEQDQASTFRQLLKQAETNPQQAFMAAQQLGIDVSRIPQPNTPEFEPWRQQQLFIADALERDKDSLPGLAQEVMLALPQDQRDPNSPVFRQAFTAALENKYAAEYTDAQGNTRRRAIIGQPQQQQQTASAPAQVLPRSARPAGMTDDQLFAMARQSVEQGASVDAVFQQLREWGVEVN